MEIKVIYFHIRKDLRKGQFWNTFNDNLEKASINILFVLSWYGYAVWQALALIATLNFSDIQ